MQEAVLPASSQGLTGQKVGLVIASVNPRSLAARAGLLVGDVLLGMAGVPVEDVASLRGALVRAASAGDSIRLRVMRGGEIREIEVDFKAGRARARGA
jgi:S1-C subfamily serine protease